MPLWLCFSFFFLPLIPCIHTIQLGAVLTVRFMTFVSKQGAQPSKRLMYSGSQYTPQRTHSHTYRRTYPAWYVLTIPIRRRKTIPRAVLTSQNSSFRKFGYFYEQVQSLHIPSRHQTAVLKRSHTHNFSFGTRSTTSSAYSRNFSGGKKSFPFGMVVVNVLRCMNMMPVANRCGRVSVCTFEWRVWLTRWHFYPPKPSRWEILCTKFWDVPTGCPIPHEARAD